MITKLFEKLTSQGKISIVQEGFLYSDRVDTRSQELILKDFIILVRYLLKNKYLNISFMTKGADNANKIIADLKNTGLSVEILKNELFWIIEIDNYEVDLLLSIDLPEERKKKLIEDFYVIRDAILVYPIGYMSWSEHFKKNPHLL